MQEAQSTLDERSFLKYNSYNFKGTREDAQTELSEMKGNKINTKDRDKH